MKAVLALLQGALAKLIGFFKGIAAKARLLFKGCMAAITRLLKSIAASVGLALKSVFTAVMGFLKSVAKILIIVGALAVVIIVVVAMYFVKHPKTTEYSFTSRFQKAIEIDELSVSEFVYNGIADVRNSKGKKLYSMTYDSTVKVGVQVSDIAFEVDDAQKTVKVTLPALTIQTPVIDLSYVSFMEEPDDLDTSEAVAACREDARLEAEQSGDLMQAAEENLQSIIEALTLPILKETGYEVVW